LWRRVAQYKQTRKRHGDVAPGEQVEARRMSVSDRCLMCGGLEGKGLWAETGVSCVAYMAWQRPLYRCIPGHLSHLSPPASLETRDDTHPQDPLSLVVCCPLVPCRLSAVGVMPVLGGYYLYRLLMCRCACGVRGDWSASRGGWIAYAGQWPGPGGGGGSVAVFFLRLFRISLAANSSSIFYCIFFLSLTSQ